MTQRAEQSPAAISPSRPGRFRGFISNRFFSLTNMHHDNESLPLAGIRVLEFTHLVMGPRAA